MLRSIGFSSNVWIHERFLLTFPAGLGWCTIVSSIGIVSGRVTVMAEFQLPIMLSSTSSVSHTN